VDDASVAHRDGPIDEPPCSDQVVHWGDDTQNTDRRAHNTDKKNARRRKQGKRRDTAVSREASGPTLLVPDL
jgi:hypothetical protein